jgi:hypothetical protein
MCEQGNESGQSGAENKKGLPVRQAFDAGFDVQLFGL